MKIYGYPMQDYVKMLIDNDLMGIEKTFDASQTVGMGDGRISLQVQVDEGAAKLIRAYCKERGRIQKNVVSRLLEWWVRQPAHVRTATTADVDEGMEYAYATALDRLASELRAKLASGEVAFIDEAEAEKIEPSKPAPQSARRGKTG